MCNINIFFNNNIHTVNINDIILNEKNNVEKNNVEKNNDKKNNIIVYLYNYVMSKYGLHDGSFYLINLDNNKIIRNVNVDNNDVYVDNNDINVEIMIRIKGGSIMKKIINPVIKFIFKIFDPIVKPLAGIANAILMLLKAIVYMAMLLIWIIKFMIWFFTDFILSFPADLITLIKRIVYIIFDAVYGVIFGMFKKMVNKSSNLTLNAMMGWDNVPDDDDEDKKNNYFKDDMKRQKCYRTDDGLIPFSVIIATILCPPIGVFMEYGILGWFNILICTILTLLFYIPGLIYALILLYC
jgi:uncharacterized membrane protein YqaE (UPF0057 family)